VTGNGVGREVYVKEVNVSGSRLTLSRPLYGANSTQSYTFDRFRYALDFSGFERLTFFTLQNIEFQLHGRCSAVMLARAGSNFQIKDCLFNKPKDRGVTSPGSGCADLHIDRCQFTSSEQGLLASERTSVGFNVNSNDSKIRDNRFQRMGLTGILSGGNNIIAGNHMFQGDSGTNTARTPGLVFAYEVVGSIVSGNYIDNCYIEWTNEHDPAPDLGAEYSFGGLTITGNIFLAGNTNVGFNFIVLKPYGAGHFLSGLHVNENVFRVVKSNINRVEGVDTSFADLDPWRCRNLTFERNTFHGVNDPTSSPSMLKFEQNSNAKTWTLNVSSYLPFGGNARKVTAVVAEGLIRNASNNQVEGMPYVEVNQGANNDRIQLVWPEPCRGTVMVTTRVDNPI
jgi:hypothetical protein